MIPRNAEKRSHQFVLLRPFVFLELLWARAGETDGQTGNAITVFRPRMDGVGRIITEPDKNRKTTENVKEHGVAKLNCVGAEQVIDFVCACVNL